MNIKEVKEQTSEKVAQVVKSLKEISEELKNPLLVETYYHDIFLNDFIKYFENVVVNRGESDYIGY